MSHLIKGIASFPAVFTPKIPKGSTEPKFSIAVLIAPGDPQIAVLQAAVEAAKAESFPSGYNGTDECFGPYDTMFAGKDYYDPKFSGYWVFKCSAKADDRPAVVDENQVRIIDPGAVFPGCVVYVSAGISGYTKGKGGIGGWLNGVMVTAEEPPMGRLDSKPTVDQMFAGVDASAAPVAATAQAPVAAVAPPPAAPAPAPTLVMKDPNGPTYESYQEAGWSDQQLIDAGHAIKPSFA